MTAAFKGFSHDLKCRDFQFEPGKTYTHDGPVEACASGFHACEHPLDVFSYYPPAGNRFFAVTLGGTLARHGSVSKIAAASVTLGAELKIPDLVAAAIKYVFDRSKPEGETATGYSGRVLGAAGCALFLVYRNPSNWEIEHAWAGIAGRDSIKADTWYTLNAKGEPIEWKDA